MIKDVNKMTQSEQIKINNDCLHLINLYLTKIHKDVFDFYQYMFPPEGKKYLDENEFWILLRNLNAGID